MVTRGIALDDEALRRGKRGEVDDLTRETRRRHGRAKSVAGAKHHVGLASSGTAVISAPGPNDEVVEAVAIDVPRRGDGEACPVHPRVALDDEALCGVERPEFDDLAGEACRRHGGAEAAAGTEHHVGLAGSRGTVVATISSYDEIVEAVAVDVPGRRD